jgi:hypothetical protein
LCVGFLWGLNKDIKQYTKPKTCPPNEVPSCTKPCCLFELSLGSKAYIGPFVNLPGENMRFLFKFNFNINIDKDGNFKSISHTNSSGKTSEYSLEAWNKIFKNLDPRDTNTTTNATNDTDITY